MKIGRNEPCPCGSGKKYKKCCLNINVQEKTLEKDVYKDITEGLLNLHKFVLKQKTHIKKYHHLRKIHGEILDSMINYFDSGKYSLNAELAKLAEYNQKQLKKIKDYELDTENILLFDLKFNPNSDAEMMFFYGLSVYKGAPPMKSITEIYLEKNKLRSKEKIDLLNAMNDAYTSIFQITSIDTSNGYVFLKDTLSNKKFKIIDEALSMYEESAKNKYLYTRIITVDNISFGNCSLMINSDNSEINNLIEIWKKNSYTIHDLSITFYRIISKEGMIPHIVNSIR